MKNKFVYAIVGLGLILILSLSLFLFLNEEEVVECQSGFVLAEDHSCVSKFFWDSPAELYKKASVIDSALANYCAEIDSVKCLIQLLSSS